MSPEIRSMKRFIADLGAPWRIDLGGKHFKIMCGERLIAIMPKGGGDSNGRGARNIMAQIKRAQRDLMGHTTA